MPFSKAQVDSYIASKACPYCGEGDDIGEIDADGIEWYLFECSTCNRQWWETWSLTNITEVEE